MHRVVHFEIHADNPDRAIKFYSKVFGWEFNMWPGQQEYWIIKTGPDSQPGINGGLIRRRGILDGTAVTAYVCTVDIPSVEDHVKMVEASGGVIVVPRMAIPNVGWLVYAKDTEGNIFGATQFDPAAR